MVCQKSNFISREFCQVCGNKKYKSIFKVDYLGSWVEEKYLARIKLKLGSLALGIKIPSDILKQFVYDLRCCTSCHFIWQANVLSDENMMKFYSDTWFPSKNAYHPITPPNTIECNWYLSKLERARSICSLFGKRKTDEVNILDYGSGANKFATLLANLGFNVSVCDFNVQEDCQWYINPKEHIGEFDYVHLASVLEHATDVNEVLENIMKLLRPDGFLYISVPDGKSIKNWSPSMDLSQFKNISTFGHINLFNHENLVYLAKRHGMEVHPLLTNRLTLKPIPGGHKQTKRRIMRNILRKMKNLLSFSGPTGTSIVFRRIPVAPPSTLTSAVEK